MNKGEGRLTNFQSILHSILTMIQYYSAFDDLRNCARVINDNFKAFLLLFCGSLAARLELYQWAETLHSSSITSYVCVICGKGEHTLIYTSSNTLVPNAEHLVYCQHSQQTL